MKNWKTNSAGIAMIVSGIAGFYFAFKTGNLSEITITSLTTAILGGIGLLFGADSKKEE